MSETYLPGFYTVTSWNNRALASQAAPRRIYRGTDPSEATRIFEGLAERKRRGLVEMTNPFGQVSTASRGGRGPDWTTFYGHELPPAAVVVQLRIAHQARGGCPNCGSGPAVPCHPRCPAPRPTR